DNLESAQFISIHLGDKSIGFAAKKEQILWFIYIRKEHLRYAPRAFDQIINEHDINTVYFQTTDSLMTSLVMDYEFEKTKGAYFFADAMQGEKPRLDYNNMRFVVAKHADIAFIREHTGTFFDNLELEIEREHLFLLWADKELLGCGIVAPSKFATNYASIGMITCKAHRGKGVGKTILWLLKEWCYQRGLKPIAGCWYYNTLSRKTLESVGLLPVGRGMRAKLLHKEHIPERTGNPPGEAP
ncbi:MAG: GNAT family N-acetyltransferase, partial [bacterium]|nr:GNAT family N-acetyltransferase [bacterium]